MELATIPSSPISVRTLGDLDRKSITDLLKRATTVHVHPDWYLLVDWLGTPGFVGVFTRDYLDGFLAVGAESLPAFWVRGCAFAYRRDRQEQLGRLLEAVRPWLVQKEATILGWMTSHAWLQRVLLEVGFKQLSVIATMNKWGWEVPKLPVNPDVQVRAVQAADFSGLAGVERETFAPLWRYNRQTLLLAAEQSAQFDVVVLRGEVVGYQCTTYHGDSAHLARIVVHPEAQGQGAGSALLRKMVAQCRQDRVSHLSLNMQISNESSRYLYEKFGFQFVEGDTPIWGMEIEGGAEGV